MSSTPAPTGRRRFTTQYKRSILEQAAAAGPAGVDGLLRREGLRSSYLARWAAELGVGAGVPATTPPTAALPAAPAAHGPQPPAGRRASVKKLVELAEPLAYDLRHPVAYLYLWYEAYQKIMRWMGAVAGGMLTFTASFLLKDLLLPAAAEPGAAGLQLAAFDPALLRTSLLLLAGSLISVLINLLVTYQWLVAGIKSGIEPQIAAMQQEGVLEGDLEREFHSYGAVLSMQTWGRVSFILGGVAGALLLAGVGLYVAAAWGLISSIGWPGA